MKYVADYIGEEYKSWAGGEHIIISAPTGSGKTSFILNELLPFAASRKKRICYFTNRTALKEQLQKILKDNYESYASYIDVINYQKLYSMINAVMHQSNAYNAEFASYTEGILFSNYYVFDEAHYLVADAYFNYDLGEFINLLHTMLYEINPFSTKIITSASTEYLKLSTYLLTVPKTNHSKMLDSYYSQLPVTMSQKSYITRILRMKFLSPTHPFYDMYNNNGREYPLIYTSIYGNGIQMRSLFTHSETADDPNRCDSFQKYFDKYIQQPIDNVISNCRNYILDAGDHGGITPVYFNNYDEISIAVKTTPLDEKWLIFVSAKDEAWDLLQKLNNQPFDTVVITADNKKRSKSMAKEQFQSITTHEFFTSRVMIATSVLDNGINLKDDAIKHVVIPGCLKYEFQQMLGRKRRKSTDEHFTVYIQNIPEAKMLNKTHRDIVWNLQKLRNQDPSKRNSVRSFRLIYDFYDQMSMFEKSQDNRFHVMQALIDYTNAQEKNEEKLQAVIKQYQYLFPILKDYPKLLENCSVSDELWLKNTDIALMNSDFMWLREQLSWLGMSYSSDDSPLNPHNPDPWITQHIKSVIVKFLESHIGMLDDDEESELKRLFMVFIRSVRPIHKYYHSKGSHQVITDCFTEFNIPYRIISKRATCNKKQQQRWFVENGLPDSSE